MSHNIRSWSLWTVLLLPGLCGCGSDYVADRQLPAPVRVAESAPVLKHIVAAPLTQPLTAADIESLVGIASQLPGGRLPAFDSAPEVANLNVSLNQFVANEQQRLRLSLDPQWQAQHWERNPELQSRLNELHVAPLALASLMVRVSGSWMAQMSVAQQPSSLSHSGPSTYSDQQLATMEHQFARQLRSASMRDQSRLTDWEHEQLRNSLRETIACIEVLRLTATVPAESIQTVATHRALLAPLLPADNSRQLERRTESNAPIIQASGWQ